MPQTSMVAWACTIRMFDSDLIFGLRDRGSPKYRLYLHSPEFSPRRLIYPIKCLVIYDERSSFLLSRGRTFLCRDWSAFPAIFWASQYVRRHHTWENVWQKLRWMICLLTVTSLKNQPRRQAILLGCSWTMTWSGIPISAQKTYGHEVASSDFISLEIFLFLLYPTSLSTAKYAWIRS